MSKGDGVFGLRSQGIRAFIPKTRGFGYGSTMTSFACKLVKVTTVLENETLIRLHHPHIVGVWTLAGTGLAETLAFDGLPALKVPKSAVSGESCVHRYEV